MSAASSSSLKRLFIVVILIGGLIAFFALGGPRFLSFEALARNRAVLIAWREEHAVLAIFVFVATYALVAAFSVPGGLWLTITAGFLFGALWGTVYAVIGATAGACAAFLAARYVAGDRLRRRAGDAIRRMEHAFRRNAVSYLLFLRLVPVFPFWLVNLVPAFLGVSFRLYLLTTVVGIIPGALVYALVGNGLGTVLDAGGKPDLDIIFEPEVLAPLLGLSLLALLPVLWRRHDNEAAPAKGDRNQ
jgi:uncharacterized membrane protein YdjX (TVP38/TMEM64 family)